MTPQDAFNAVKRHLLTQGRKALDSNGLPCYIAENGDRCAVGSLINLRADGTWMLDKWCGIGMPLFIQLRCCHDEYEPHQWAARLDEIAAEFGLDP